jgi:hypothetical protein
MDHQVQDNVNIKRPGRKTGQAMTLNKTRLFNLGQDCLEGRVKALDMTDLENGLMLSGQFDECLGIRGFMGNGFFDKGMDTAFDEFAGNGVMGDCGCHDTHGIKFLFKQGFIGGVELGLVLLGQDLAALGIGIYDGGQGDIRQGMTDAGMFLTQMPDPDDSDLEWFHKVKKKKNTNSTNKAE